MEMEVNVVKNLSHKSLLVMIKYIPHTIAFAYAIYTFLGICGIDCNMFGCFFHVSLATWIILYSLSIVFKYCYVHRLPIYYIGLNELITCLDYYLDIELDYFTFIIVSLLLSFSLIFGYTYYYLKMRDYRKFCRPKAKKNPQFGDVLVTLNCGLNLYVDDEDFSRIKKSFRKYSIVGNRLSRPGYIKIYNSTLDEDMIISPEDYNNLFKIKEIVGLKLILDANNPALDGDIICQNSIINREIIFSYEDWINLDDSWDATGLYEIETFDNDDEVTELRYVIMANGTTFIIKAEDYSKVSSEFEIVDTINIPITDYVDLDLPSGLLWAKGNIVKDANGNYSVGNETDYGCYFSWGNVEGHNEGEGYNFNQTNYDSTPGKQVSADIASNDSTHDAALATLGGSCRMPTKAEFQELYDNTDTEWTTIDGVVGRKFMKKSDHSVYIFFPAAGYYSGTSLSYRGSYGYYWSASFSGRSYGYSLHFTSSYVGPQYNGDRMFGFSVRAVQ